MNHKRFHGLNIFLDRLLVTGAWGVGKTYQVRECLTRDRHYYVSLFGLKTTEEVHAAVIVAIAPKLEIVRKSVRQIGRASEKLGGWFSLGGSASSLINATLRKEIIPDRTLIFDDLERCNLELKESMGIINTYIEQHGFGVVVIAHDEKLVDEFSQAKEKIFGQTIKVEPEIEEAFDNFLSDAVDREISNFIGIYRGQIFQAFRESKASSLRLLRHIIGDISRLYVALEANHLENPEAIKELLGLFCALNIEVRAGNLKAEDLQNRANAHMTYELRRHSNKNEEIERSPFLRAADKHVSANLESQILTDTVLIAALFDGRYAPDEIRGSINNSLFISDPGDTPPWKIVINFDEIEDSKVEDAAARMCQQFEKREITDSGEMLHVFSLRMMMSENGIIEPGLEDVRDQCIAYIDDLLNSGQLPARGLGWRWFDDFQRGHDGYGYWVTQGIEPYFKDLWDRLVKAREAALERSFPEITKELLRLMGTDGPRFREQISHTESGENPYALIPILAAIPPVEFVETWLKSPSSNWRSISSAIEDRYTPDRLEQELASERPWAIDVSRIFESKQDQSDGFRSLRIQRTIPSIMRQLAEPDGVEEKDDKP